MVKRRSPISASTDYQAQYDDYWSMDDRIGESSGDLEQTAEQILMSCGVGRTLDIGSGEGVLVASLLRHGVDAHGLDVSKVVVSRCNQRFSDRFTQGSVLSIPYADESFQTVVSTNCIEYLAPEHVPIALKEIYRVASRYVFLKLSTTQDRDSHWHLTVEGRAWWEMKCFEAGFRKHPAYYRINSYESLNQDGMQITIPLEKVPLDALLQYPLTALQEGRDLHMDMLRENGSRSDAHVSRYHFACRYVRPGDIVIDAACGLGYGTHLIRTLTKCATINGIDGNSFAADYASTNFTSDGTIKFIQGLLPECLLAIPDNSVDSVICFETLEHVNDPTALLSEFHRILMPGGRFISSVPHDWSDETGEDPNPFHLHVYTRPKFISELSQYFEIEHLACQTADRIKKPGSRCEWAPRLRSLHELDPHDKDTPVEAEWLLAVACKTPLNGACVPYVEKVFSQVEQAASGNALAFARDYLNPWLIRSLVSIGLRTENPILRVRWAREILRTAPITSADYGAALCILAYIKLTELTVAPQNDLIRLAEQYTALRPVSNPNVLRWQVSISHVLGLIALAQGRRVDAKQHFRRVLTYPVAAYSLTLLTKPAEAAYQLGLLYAADGDLGEAESVWAASLSTILNDIGQHFASSYSALPPVFEIREITAALSIMARLVAAIDHAQKIVSQPSIFFDQVNEDLVAKLPWLTSQLKAWEQTAAKREQSIETLQEQVQELLSGNAWLSSQRQAWEQTAAKREQSITALTLQLRQANERLVERDAMLNKIRSHWGMRIVNLLCKKQIFL